MDRVPVLPDPEEDIRILGVPVGRLLWLGPLLILPLLAATVLFSVGLVVAIPVALVLFLAIYALLGLDLWRPIYWAVSWWFRPERQGIMVPEPGRRETHAVAPGGPGRTDAMVGWLRLIGARPSRLDGDEGGTASASVTVNLPAIEYADPQGLWRRWGDALRRALGRGATVQVITWLEPDWRPTDLEAERRTILRATAGELRDLAAERWHMHRELSVAAGRRVIHLVRVISHPGAATGDTLPADLTRACGTALAGGGGSWASVDGAGQAGILARFVDWQGWFRQSGGPADLLDQWLAGPGGGETGDVGLAGDGLDSAVDNPVDSTVDNVDADGHRLTQKDGHHQTGVGGAGEVQAVVGEEIVEALPADTPCVAARSRADDEAAQTPFMPPGYRRASDAELSGGTSPAPVSPLAVIERVLSVVRPGRGDAASAPNEPAPDTPATLERPARPLVAVWSTAPAGKTTVAIELAAALARGGLSVALLDLDTRSRTLAGRLCLPPGTHTLSGALAARPIDPLPDGAPVWPGVVAFADAPDAPPLLDLSLWRLGRLLAAGAPDAEWWVADLPGDGSSVAHALDAAWAVVLVADPDWSRVADLRRAYREWMRTGKPVLPVVNRWVEQVPGVPHVSPAEVLGADPAAVFPFDPAVYAAAVTGRPAASQSPAVAAAADELALAVGRVILTRGNRGL